MTKKNSWKVWLGLIIVLGVLYAADKGFVRKPVKNAEMMRGSSVIEIETINDVE